MNNKLSKILIFTILFVFGVGVTISFSQQSLEIGSASAPSGTANDGPAETVTFELLHNINNPTDDLFTIYKPQTEIIVTVSNQQYSSSQDTDNDNGGTLDSGDFTLGSFTPGENPAYILGWTYNGDPVQSGTEQRDGSARDLLSLFNVLGQSNPNSADYSSVEDLSNGDGTGSGISVDQNFSAFIAGSFEGLRNEIVGLDGSNPARYLMGTITINFTKPITNPILHFLGLGGRWFYDVPGEDLDSGNDTRFINSATLEFDLDIASSSTVTEFVSLSGTDNFEVDDGNKRIRNNADYPDVNDDSTLPQDFGVGSGSALVRGEEVTTLVFNVYARGMNGPEFTVTNFQGSGVDLVVGNEAWGWSGGGTITQTTEPDYTFPTVNFPSDAFKLSVSAEVEPDEVLLTSGDSYRMLTSPVVSQVDDGTNGGNLGIFYDDLIGQLWTQGVNGPGYDTQFGTPNIYTWDKGTDESNGWQSISDLTTARINPGEGFLMTVFEDDNFDETIDTNEEFGNENGNKLLSVTGSEAAPPIVVTDGIGGGDADGWILAGNPFKEPIDITELLANRIDNFNDVVYIWDRGTQPYPSNNPGWRWAINDPNVTSTTGNPVLGNLIDANGDPQTVIMPFQGFFLEKTDATQSTVTFDDDNTLTRSSLVTTADADDQFFRKDRETENLLVLNLEGESLENSLWFRFSENGSNERLTNDVLELASYSENYAYFSTKKQEGDLLTLAQLPIPNEETEIPVTIETTRAGSYTINASEANLSLPYDLYFVDLQNEESIRIDQNFSYTFTVNQAAKSNPVDFTLKGPQKAKTVAATDRFLITTQPKEFGSELPTDVALNQNYPNPFNPTTQITYQLPQQSDVRLQVFDMAGRQVATLVNESVNAGTHTVNFDASSLSSGVYLYKLQAGSTVLTRKLTLIK